MTVRRWSHRWLTPKAASQQSPVHGVGIAALERIMSGEIVAVIGGIVVPVTELAVYRKKVGHLGIQVNDKFSLCPESREELSETGAFNHSCNPNIGFSNSVTLVAMRTIDPGDELVFDYAFSESAPFEPFDCKCGSTNCRKRITHNDWRLWEAQRNAAFFSPYLNRQLAASKARF